MSILSKLFGTPVAASSLVVNHSANLASAVVTVELSKTANFATISQTIAEGANLVVVGPRVELKPAGITGNNGKDTFYRVKADGVIIASGRLIAPASFVGALRRRGRR